MTNDSANLISLGWLEGPGPPFKRGHPPPKHFWESPPIREFGISVPRLRKLRQVTAGLHLHHRVEATDRGIQGVPPPTISRQRQWLLLATLGELCGA